MLKSSRESIKTLIHIPDIEGRGFTLHDTKWRGFIKNHAPQNQYIDV